MWFRNLISSENFSPQTAQLFMSLLAYHQLFRLSHHIEDGMQKSFRLSKLSFLITPSEEGYLVACNEIPYLFTDVAKVEEIDEKIRQMITEYIEYFPYDATKRGVDKNIVMHMAWKASPNGVALN